MAFAPIESGERAEEIGRRLRNAIELGVLEDRSQLPSEADLAGRMGVSTLTLRAALADLRHQGLLETRRGRGGGSFVKASTESLTHAQLEVLAAYSIEDLRDLREYRAHLAGSAASATAERSRQISTTRLISMAMAIESAGSPALRTRADSRFHIELAGASGSVRLTRQEMAVQGELAPLLWVNGDHDAAQDAAQRHDAIVDAIRRSDARLARNLAEAHARDDVNRLIDARLEMRRRVPPRTGLAGSRPDHVIASAQAMIQGVASTVSTSIQAIEDAVLSRLRDGSHASVDIPEVYDVAQESLGEASPTLWGLGFIADPSYFGDPGLVWCYTPSGPGAPERLVIDPEFYDYDTAPWWPDPEQRSGEGRDIQATHAYVDASGTNEYIVTFSKQLWHAGEMVGVAAADVLVSHLQAICEPLLLSLPHDACVVDQTNVVIATNRGHLLGGILSRTETDDFSLPGVPWRLHIAPIPSSG